MSPEPRIVSHAENGAPHFTALVNWQHRRGPAHCLVRAAYDPQALRAVAVVSELASNPDDRGITADFGRVADAVLPLLREVFPEDVRQAVWIAHFGDFSYHDPGGPETFTQVSLRWEGDHFADDRKGDRRLSEADVLGLLGGRPLRPVPEVLSELGRQG